MASRYVTALRGFLNRSTPGYLIFFVTPYCNCTCKMCFNAEVIDHASSRRTLTIEEIERVARNFPGLHHVNFSGGEPFLRRDFPEIPPLFYAHSGARFFTCATNSSLPEKIEAAVRAICQRCPDAWLRITQSLDGIGELHDFIRGRPGLFDCVVDVNRRLARLCRDLPNLSTGISMVLSKFNVGHEYEILDYVYDRLEFTDFGILYVRGDTRDPGAGNVAKEAYRDIQREAMRRARARPMARGLSGRLFAAINHTVVEHLVEIVMHDRFVAPCQAGRRMVVMDDEGNIEPCEVLRTFIRNGTVKLERSALGNVRDFDYDIRRILATDHARAVVESIVRNRCYCTFECAMAVNVLYNPRVWPRVLRNLLLLGRRGGFRID